MQLQSLTIKIIMSFYNMISHDLSYPKVGYSSLANDITLTLHRIRLP